MIARSSFRRILTRKSLTSSAASIICKSKASFSRKIQKTSSNYASIIQSQIKAEESNLSDISDLQATFKKQGWSLARKNNLVQLSKNDGKYAVRLLSKIKSPSSFDEGEEGKDQNQQPQQQPYEGDKNKITICITKSGSDKTMVVNTVVIERFEITNITFADNYQLAKQPRLDVFNTNNFTGPETETIPEQLFDAVQGFLEQECKVDNQLLGFFADYCVQSEQKFYVSWLKDLRSFL